MNRLVAKIELDNGIIFSVKEDSLPLLIGRAASCDICVPMSRVSRRHCELFLVNDVLCIKDISSNGTTVGSRKLKGETISIQDRISILFTDESMITVTPCAMDDVSDDRRLLSDRRQNVRRQTGNRTNVTVLDFERRRVEDRRCMNRRAA